MALLRLVLSLVLRHRFKLLAWIATCTALAFFYVNSVPYSYTASAVVLLKARQSAMSGTANVLASSLDMSSADSELQVIRSERLLANVFNTLLSPQSPALVGEERKALMELMGQPATPLPESTQAAEGDPAAEEAWQRAFAKFARGLDVRRVGQSYVVAISYTANDPVVAERIANAVASAYLLQSVEVKQTEAESGAEILSARLEALREQVSAARDAVARGVVPARPISAADAQIIGAARTPLEPSAPRKKLIILFGAVLGVISAALVLTLRQAFDRRIITAADLVEVSHLPCIVVPKVPGRYRRRKRPPRATMAIVMDNIGTPFAAAMRDIRTIVGSALPQPPHGGGRCVALVAWHSGAGCSFLTHNLADLDRHSGQCVTVIEADVHNAKASRVAGESAAMSLADVLVHGIPISDVRYTNRDGIDFLPATSRDRRTNYLADLCSAELTHLIDHATAMGDVFLDLPPLSAFADGKAVARRAEAVLLVARTGKTRASEVRRAIAALNDADAPVVGVILNCK